MDIRVSIVYRTTTTIIDDSDNDIERDDSNDENYTDNEDKTKSVPTKSIEPISKLQSDIAGLFELTVRINQQAIEDTVAENLFVSIGNMSLERFNGIDMQSFIDLSKRIDQNAIPAQLIQYYLSAY